MASVEIRPGDTLSIVWTSEQDTPLGRKEVESSFAFGYDELMTRLKGKGRAGKSRRSGTDGAKFSRMVALSTSAMRKGKWSTGADISREEVFDRLLNRFGQLEETEYANITENARNSLLKLYNNKGIMKGQQKKVMKKMIESIGIEA